MSADAEHFAWFSGAFQVVNYEVGKPYRLQLVVQRISGKNSSNQYFS